MTVSFPRLSILPDGHEDSDEATDIFRRVRDLPLSISHACERSKRQDGSNVKTVSGVMWMAVGEHTITAVLEYTLVSVSVAVPAM